MQRSSTSQPSHACVTWTWSVEHTHAIQPLHFSRLLLDLWIGSTLSGSEGHGVGGNLLRTYREYHVFEGFKLARLRKGIVKTTACSPSTRRARWCDCLLCTTDAACIHCASQQQTLQTPAKNFLTSEGVHRMYVQLHAQSIILYRDGGRPMPCRVVMRLPCSWYTFLRARRHVRTLRCQRHVPRCCCCRHSL